MTFRRFSIWLSSMLWPMMVFAVEPSTEIAGKTPQYAHFYQNQLFPAASSIGSTLATRPGTSPHETLDFGTTGNPVALLYFTYPRYASVNRFELSMEGHSTVVTGQFCFRASYLITRDATTFWADNLGGTHTSGGTPASCCGDIDGNGSVELCEATACEWHATNGLSSSFPGVAPSCPTALATPATQCDCNGDNFVTAAEATIITSQYYASGCPALPAWEGEAAQANFAVTPGLNVYAQTDIIRGYMDAVSDVKCSDFSSTDEGDRGVYCSGLPGVIVVQRLNEAAGCTDDAAGAFSATTFHVKYYTD